MKEQNTELKDLCERIRGILDSLNKNLEIVEEGRHGWKKAAYSARMSTLGLRSIFKDFRRISTRVSNETILPHYKPDTVKTETTENS